jgi:hypothetical protein
MAPKTIDPREVLGFAVWCSADGEESEATVTEENSSSNGQPATYDAACGSGEDAFHHQLTGSTGDQPAKVLYEGRQVPIPKTTGEITLPRRSAGRPSRYGLFLRREQPLTQGLVPGREETRDADVRVRKESHYRTDTSRQCHDPDVSHYPEGEQDWWREQLGQVCEEQSTRTLVPPTYEEGHAPGDRETFSTPPQSHTQGSWLIGAQIGWNPARNYPGENYGGAALRSLQLSVAILGGKGLSVVGNRLYDGFQAAAEIGASISPLAPLRQSLDEYFMGSVLADTTLGVNFGVHNLPGSNTPSVYAALGISVPFEITTLFDSSSGTSLGIQTGARGRSTGTAGESGGIDIEAGVQLRFDTPDTPPMRSRAELTFEEAEKKYLGWNREAQRYIAALDMMQTRLQTRFGDNIPTDIEAYNKFKAAVAQVVSNLEEIQKKRKHASALLGSSAPEHATQERAANAFSTLATDKSALQTAAAGLVAAETAVNGAISGGSVVIAPTAKPSPSPPPAAPVAIAPAAPAETAQETATRLEQEFYRQFDAAIGQFIEQRPFNENQFAKGNEFYNLFQRLKKTLEHAKSGQAPAVVNMIQRKIKDLNRQYFAFADRKDLGPQYLGLNVLLRELETCFTYTNETFSLRRGITREQVTTIISRLNNVKDSIEGRAELNAHFQTLSGWITQIEVLIPQNDPLSVEGYNTGRKSLTVNTSIPHYYVDGLSEKDGVAQLAALTQSARVEESWYYVEGTQGGTPFKRWYEVGVNETANTCENNSVVIDELSKKQGVVLTKVAHYHIHPKTGGYADVETPSFIGDLPTFRKQVAYMARKFPGNSVNFSMRIVTPEGLYEMSPENIQTFTKAANTQANKSHLQDYLSSNAVADGHGGITEHLTIAGLMKTTFTYHNDQVVPEYLSALFNEKKWLSTENIAELAGLDRAGKTLREIRIRLGEIQEHYRTTLFRERANINEIAAFWQQGTKLDEAIKITREKRSTAGTIAPLGTVPPIPEREERRVSLPDSYTGSRTPENIINAATDRISAMVLKAISDIIPEGGSVTFLVRFISDTETESFKETQVSIETTTNINAAAKKQIEAALAKLDFSLVTIPAEAFRRTATYSGGMSITQFQTKVGGTFIVRR